MSNLSLISPSDMGLLDKGVIVINKPIDGIVKIDGDCEIIIEKGVNVKIMDMCSNNNITVNIKDSSTLSYTIINSTNTNRVFNVEGELSITEISLSDNIEGLTINLNSSHSLCDVKCLSILSGKANAFNQMVIHNAIKTTSNIQNVGVAWNGAIITFDTTGKVTKGMSESKCAQLSRGIVMDEDSLIKALPILLIDEYDCFANHGATIGKMSDEDLFYLMSRGLTKKEAFLLILRGIISPYVDSIESEDIKGMIENQIEKMIESD